MSRSGERRAAAARRPRRAGVRVLTAIALATASALATPAAIVHGQDGTATRPITPDDLGGVIVSVVMPSDGGGLLDADARHLLEARMGAALAGAGVAGVASVTPFVIYPIAAIVDEQQTTGGLEPRTVVALEVSFVVRHVASGSIIHQWTRRLVGTAPTRDGAVRQALASLRPGEASLGTFGVDVRRRIVDYYERSCDAIRANARAAAAAGRGAQRLAELAAVPSDAATCQRAALRDLAELARPGRERPRAPSGPRATPPGAPPGLAPGARLQAVAYMNSAGARATMTRLVYTRP